MIPILAYQYVKKRNEANRKKMAEEPTSNSAGRSAMPDVVVLRISAVGTKNNDGTYIAGVLQVVEKTRGVFIEWIPAEDSPVSGWVLADGNDENALLSTSPPQRSFRENVNKLKFSMDVNDLNSFKHVERKKSDPMIHLIGRDGSKQVPLYFRQTSTNEFIDCLQKYITLRRSSKDSDLVLVVDEKADLLAKSVVALDNNSDILSRFMGNPYATAMTGLGKITAYMQEQVIPALLDSDEVGAEDKIRAMRELRNDDEFGDRIRYKESSYLHVYRGEDQGDFEMVTQLELPPRPEIYRETPVTKQIWDSYKNPHGSFDQRNLHNLKMCVFRGGVEPELRKEAWKYLLGYIRWNESLAEHKLRRQELEKDYYRMKGQWMSINAEQESRFLMFSNRKSLVEKDVARTDRTYKYFEGEGNANLTRLHDVLMTYCMYNFDLGYVQGMSDFCSPILFVLEDEVDAFWCFTKLMDIVHSNFAEDQLSIKQQLNQLHDLVMIVNPKLCNYLESHQSDDMYFCFRWILVWFKREFSFEDTSKLWEVLWTKQPCTNFLLLICVAILDKETEFIIANGFGLTEILKHVNELSMHINLDEVLSAAEAIFHQLSASQDKLPKYVLDHLRLSEPDQY